MTTVLREKILRDAKEIADEMRATGLLYQSLVRDPNLRLSPNESNSEKRRTLAGECRTKFLREPFTTARELEVAGYPHAAEELRNLARELKKFSLIEVSWDDDDSYTLEIPVESTYKSSSDALTRAEAFSVRGPSDEDLSILIAAANCGDDLEALADDFLLYFEGWMPAGYDPEETDDDRMAQVRDEYDALPSETVVRSCEARGMKDISQYLSRLIELTASVVHLPPSAYPVNWMGHSSSPQAGGQQIDTDEARTQIENAKNQLIQAVLAHRDRLSRSS